MADNIAQYTSKVPVFRPSETGIESTAASARRIGAFYNQRGQELKSLGQEVGSSVRDLGDAVVEQQYQSEVSHGAVGFSGKMLDWTTDWRNTAKGLDPNDSTAGQKWLAETFEPQAAAFKEGFTTQKGQAWAEHRIDAARDMLRNTVVADMSTKAKEAVYSNQTRIVNADSQVVHNNPNMIFDYVKDGGIVDTNAATAASHHMLTPADSAAVEGHLKQTQKQALVKAAVLGIANKDPKGVEAFTSDPRIAQYITPQETDQFVKAAIYYQRLNDSETRSARVQQDYEKRLDFNRQINTLEAKTMPQKAGDAPQLPKDYWDTMRNLSIHPGAALEPTQLDRMTKIGNSITAGLDKPEALARVSHKTTMDLLARIRATDQSRLNDVTPIYKAFEEGALNRTDLHFLTNEFTQMRTPEGEALGRDRTEFFKRYAGSIDGAMDLGGHSALGSQKLYEAEMDARRLEADLRKNGKDPHEVYDPRSPSFFGSPANLTKYRITLEQANKHNEELNKAAKAAPLPGPAATPAPPARPSWVPPDAKRHMDGSWVVERNGRLFRVNPRTNEPEPVQIPKGQ